MTIAESLKRFRKEFNLSQREVAEVWGATPQAYQIYERSKDAVIPSAAVIIKLADAFNVSTDYLLGRSDTPQPTLTKTADEELINAVVAYRTATKTFDKFLAERGIE